MEQLLMNGQEIKLKNPGTKGLKDILILQQVNGRMPKIEMKGKTKQQIAAEMEEKGINFMNYMNDKDMDSLTHLVDLSLQKTFPGEKYTDEVDEWAMENSILIISNVMEMCSPKEQTDDQSRVEALKEKLAKDNDKSAE